MKSAGVENQTALPHSPSTPDEGQRPPPDTSDATHENSRPHRRLHLRPCPRPLARQAPPSPPDEPQHSLQVSRSASPEMRRGRLHRHRQNEGAAADAPQARSAGKSTCKSTVQVLPRGVHIGISAQQVGLLESELYRTSHACSDIQLPLPCICPFFLTRTVPLRVSISFHCSPSYSFSLSPSAVSCAPSFPNLFKLSCLYLEAPGGLSESRSLQVVCMHINLANDIAQKYTVLLTHFNNLKFCELRKNSVPTVGTFLPYSEDIKSMWCEFGGRSES